MSHSANVVLGNGSAPMRRSVLTRPLFVPMKLRAVNVLTVQRDTNFCSAWWECTEGKIMLGGKFLYIFFNFCSIQKFIFSLNFANLTIQCWEINFCSIFSYPQDSAFMWTKRELAVMVCTVHHVR